MSLDHQSDQYENAPEAITLDNYTHPTKGNPHIYAGPPTERMYQSMSTEPKLLTLAPRRGTKRFWVLPLVGLLIAVIAGLVGGFIGAAIQDQDAREPSTTPSLTSPLSPAPSNGTSTSIMNVDTGCNFPESKAESRRIPSETAWSKTRYTTICNSGWSRTAIIGLYTLTPSDCIESCLVYNNFERQRHRERERLCVGAGFIPDWLNQTLAYSASEGSPFNCFLQHNVTGIGPNDREQDGVEVVALCLNGCP